MQHDPRNSIGVPLLTVCLACPASAGESIVRLRGIVTYLPGAPLPVVFAGAAVGDVFEAQVQRFDTPNMLSPSHYEYDEDPFARSLTLGGAASTIDPGSFNPGFAIGVPSLGAGGNVLSIDLLRFEGIEVRQVVCAGQPNSSEAVSIAFQ